MLTEPVKPFICRYIYQVYFTLWAYKLTGFNQLIDFGTRPAAAIFASVVNNALVGHHSS